MFAAIRSCQVPFYTTPTGTSDAQGPCVVDAATDCATRSDLTTLDKFFGPCQQPLITGVKNEYLAAGLGLVLLLGVMR